MYDLMNQASFFIKNAFIISNMMQINVPQFAIEYSLSKSKSLIVAGVNIIPIQKENVL